MTEQTTERAEERRDRLALLGACVHDSCPLNGPHWHGGIWRSSHMREHSIPPGQP